MAALIIKDTSQATFMNEAFDVGEFRDLIDILALFRCRECGFSAAGLNHIAEHLNTNACKSVKAAVLKVSSEATNKPNTQQSVSDDVQKTEDKPATEQIEESGETIYVSMEVEPETTDTTQTTPKRGRGRPRKVVAADGTTPDNEDIISKPTPVPPEKDALDWVRGSKDLEDFLCPFCDRTFISFKALSHHQQVHIDEHTSSKCSSNRPQRKRRRDITSDDSKPRPCPICPLEYLNGQTELEQHYTCHIPGTKQYRCPFCDSLFKTWPKTSDHLSAHLNSKENDRRPEYQDKGSDVGDESDVQEPWTPGRNDQDTSLQDDLDAQPMTKKRRGRPRKIPLHNETENNDRVVDEGSEIIDETEEFDEKSREEMKQMISGENKQIHQLGVQFFDKNKKDLEKNPGVVICVFPQSDEDEGEDATGDDAVAIDSLNVDPSSAAPSGGGGDGHGIETPAPVVLDNDQAKLLKTVENISGNKVDRKSQLEIHKVQVTKRVYLENQLGNVVAQELMRERCRREKRRGNIREEEILARKSVADITKDSDENELNTVVECQSFCPHCLITRASVSEVQLHIKSHIPDSKGFQCISCPDGITQCDSWSLLRLHYERAHPCEVVWPDVRSWSITLKGRKGAKYYKRPVSCLICTSTYLRNMDELTLHMKCHQNGDQTLVCPYCSSTLRDWYRGLLHMEAMHIDEPDILWIKQFRQGDTVCDICGKDKKTKLMLSQHKRKVHTPFRKDLRCKECDKEFPSWASWKRHMDAHFAKGTFKCDECDKICKNSITLSNHKRIHEGKFFMCEQCGYKSHSKFIIEKHEKMVHTDNWEKCICETCGQMFKTPGSLKLHHRRLHSGNPPLKCDACDFTCRDITYLKAHQVKKHGPKKYQCQLCPYGTMLENALQLHLRSHLEHRPYHCKVEGCYLRFRDQKTLQSHIKNSHTSDPAHRKHPCYVCGKKFKSSTMLKNHMPVHTGEKPHRCLYCTFSSSHRSTTHRHMIKSHGHQTGDTSQRRLAVAIAAAASESDTTQPTSTANYETRQVMISADGQPIEILTSGMELAENSQGTQIMTMDENGQVLKIETAEDVEGATLENIEEGTTILVMPADHVQSEVVVESQTTNHHEAAVQILHQLMQISSEHQEN